MTELSEERFAAWRSLLIAHAASLAAIERDVDRRGVIPLGWYDVLLELNAAPSRKCHMQELAELVVLSRSRVSRIVDELEQEGYVERTRCETDRRASHATLTSAGRAALKQAAPVYLAAVEEHFTRHIPATRRAQLVRALDPLLRAHGRARWARDDDINRSGACDPA